MVHADAGNFFGRLTKTGIVAALKEAKGNEIAPAWLKAKKARSRGHR